MLKAICELESISPVLFNGVIRSPKEPNETHDDWENRVWQERCETNGDDQLQLGSRRFKRAISTGARWLNLKIPGEGKATYTKHFKGGLIVMKAIPLKVKVADVEKLTIFTAPRPRDGRRWINFPMVKEWNGFLEVNILDEKITEDVFRQVLDFTGMAIGIGQGRPENDGDNGRFEALDIVFETS
jgi:hypothetical protein